MGFWDSLGNAVTTGFGPLGNALGIGGGDPSNPYRQGVVNNAQNAAGFAGQTQQQYLQNQAGLNQSIAALQAQANGQNSVSAEQLRQGNQQAQASQMSLAAGASPSNAAMAARRAAMNTAQLQYGLSGQQAVAGLQERNQAQQALAQLQLGQAGQNLQGTLGGYGVSNQGYGVALGNPQKTWGQLLQQGLAAGGQAAVAAGKAGA